MIKKKEKIDADFDIEMLEAEYRVYDQDGGLVREPGIRRASRRLGAIKKTAIKSGVPQIIGEGAKITFKAVVWSTKQLLSVIAEGIKGVGSGIVESSSGETYKSKPRKTIKRQSHPSYIDNRSYTLVMPSKKKKRPFWYIPTKEEEMLDNL